MTISTKDEIFNFLAAKTADFNEENIGDYTAITIGDRLSISRNLASQYLNELLKENKLIKINSRPVYFLHKETLERIYETKLETTIFSCFADMLSALNINSNRKYNFEKAIGHDQSINYCIEQCKAAMNYPPNGLPILMMGASGTGKSYLSKLIYEYGIDQGLIEQDKKFVVINCADYENSSEAFMEILFGKVSVNADGENMMKMGAIGHANGGILLLEEAHCLQIQCQEKIFNFLDKRQYKVVGDNKNRYISNVRIIFATTKSPDEALHKTLFRHIPVVVKLPVLEQRSIEEKEQMIISFFRKEARKMRCDICISNQVFNVLMNYDYPGNVEQLKNCIATSCANAFLHSKTKGESVNIYLYNLPENMITALKVETSSLEEQYMINIWDYQKDSSVEGMIKFFDNLLTDFKRYKAGKGIFKEFLDKGFSQMHSYYDYLMFEQKYVNTKIQVIAQVVERIFESICEKHHIHLSKNCGIVIARCIYTQMQLESPLKTWGNIKKEEIAELKKILTIELHKENVITNNLISLIKQNLDIELTDINRIFLLLNIRYYNKQITLSNTLGIIICHGYSTASSIADAANSIVGTKVFEAIDMPLTATVNSIISTVERYIQNINFRRDIVLLVDMGSLEDIGEMLTQIPNINIGIINNISTALAVHIGFEIQNEKNLEEILKETCERCVCRYKWIENTKKEDIIIFTSESGKNTADRIRDLFISSLPKKIPVNMISYDYFKLVQNGMKDEIFIKYNVLFISGTFKLEIDNVPFISVEDIMNINEVGKVYIVFTNFLDNQELELFTQNLMKNFSLQNIVQYLTILNPDKVLDMVEQALVRLQQIIDIKLNGKTLVGMYIHISCLIERLVTKTPIENYRNLDEFLQKHQKFIEQVEQSFSDVISHYSVTIPVSEIAYIHDYIVHDNNTADMIPEDF